MTTSPHAVTYGDGPMPANYERAYALNEAWDKIGTKADTYFDTIPKNYRDAIIGSLMKWSSFYYDNDVWPAADLDKWTAAHDITRRLIDQLVQPGTKPYEPPPTKPGKVIQGETIQVTGKVGKFQLPPWWLWLIGTVPPLAILYLTRKRGV